MMRSNWLTCASLAILAAPLWPQSGGFDKPTGGLVYSRGSRALRPLVGIPGSSYLGAAVLNDVSEAWVAPGGKWAFVTTQDHSALVRGLLEGTPTESATGSVMEGVDMVVWNNGASFAALYSSSTARLQRVRLTGAEVSVENPIDLSAWGTPDTLAIDGAGRIALGIAGAGIYLVDGDQSPNLLMSMARPAAAAFSDTGRLYAVDRETRRIVEFGADGSPSDFATVETAGGVDFEPAGLAISGSGNYLMMADRGIQSLRVWETATRTPADSIRLDFAPRGIERLSAGAIFLLNRPNGTEWLLVLDAADMPRVYFVPAGEESAQ
jgi:hypothetical protein